MDEADRQVPAGPGIPEIPPDPARWFARWVAILVVAGMAAAMGARPLYREVKLRRAVAMVRDGEQLARENRWGEVGRLVQVALNLAPLDPRVLRLTGRYCAQFGNVDGLNYWRMLLRSPEATRQDRLDFVDYCHKIGRPELAADELARMISGGTTDRDILLLGLDQVIRRGHLAGATQYARVLIALHGNDPEVRIKAGSAFFDAKEKAIQDQGRLLLWSVAVRPGTNQPAAVRKLASSSLLGEVELRRLIEILGAGEPGLEDRLMILELKARLEPGRRDEFLDDAVALVSRSTPPEDRCRVAAWLLGQKQAGRALEILPFDFVRRDQKMLLHHLQALQDLDRYADISQILAEPDLPIEGVSLECFRGMVEAHHGRVENALKHFRNASAKAGHRLDQLGFVARQAEAGGAARAAIEAYEKMLFYPLLVQVAAKEIFRLSAGLDDLAPRLMALQRLVELGTDDDAIINELNYVELVLGVATEQTIARAQRTFERLQGSQPARLALALAELERRQPARGLEVLDAGGFDWTRASARERAVYAAVLGANNQRDAARQTAREVNPAELKLEERSLVAKWVR